MKAALAIAMLATMASVLDQCTGHRHITGEVFLATPSGVNLKLGLVTVCAFDKSSLTVALKKRGKVAADHIERLTNIAHRAGDLATRIDTEYETLTPLLSVEISSVRKQVYDVKQRAESAINYYESGQFYFDNLPKPLGWTKTDSNGRFNLTVDQPLSEITIAANTEWLGDGSMVYWVIDLHGSSSATLANDNCIASGSSRSLLHALSGESGN